MSGFGGDPATSRFRPDIEGLRGVAVLAVVAYHAGFLPGGFIGVDVFFVLSGFLITGLLWREVEHTAGIDLAAFYLRRVRRLLPASLLVLVVTAGLAAFVLPPLQAEPALKDAAAAGAYVSNYRFAAGGTAYLDTPTSPSPVQHYWSLSVEEQFYVVWPVLILLLVGTARLLRVSRVGFTVFVLSLVGVGSFALSVRLTASSQPWAFFSLPTRAWELVAGGLLGIAATRLGRIPSWVAGLAGWTGLAAVGWSAWSFGASTAFPGTIAAIPVLGTVGVVMAGAVAPRRGLAGLLAIRPLQAVGRVSYSWYLWHWPVLVLAEAAAGRTLSATERIVLAVGSLGPAILSLQLVENPIRFSHAWAARPVRGVAWGLAGSAAAVVAVLVFGSALPRLDGGAAAAGSELAPDPTGNAVSASLAAQVHEALAGGATVQRVPSNLRPSLRGARRDKAAPFVDGCNNAFTDATVRRCVYRNAPNRPSVVAFGDSHAAQWHPALAAAAGTLDWRLTILTKAVCPPQELAVFSPVLKRQFTECTTWRARALARIEAERPDVVVVGVARHYGPEYRFDVFGEAWVTSMAALVERLQRAGSKVVVLSPTPKPPTDVPTCLSGRLRRASECNLQRAAAINAGGVEAERTAVRRAGGSYFDVAPWVCAEEVCPVIVGNLLVYRDENHFSTPFMTWLAPVVTDVLRSVGPPPASDAPPTTARR